MYLRLGFLGHNITLAATIQRDTDETSGLYAGLTGGTYERYVEEETVYEEPDDDYEQFGFNPTRKGAP